MNWEPHDLRPGDVIRIRLGSIYHYGIFVNESEVIQFGLPPVDGFREQDPRVCASDIDTFSCGQIVERGVCTGWEALRRFRPRRTVAEARRRLGQGGYNLIHNNCEHFAYACCFGVERSTQEEDARRRWYSRPILDVYLAPVEPSAGTVRCNSRNRELAQTANEVLRRQRYSVWRALEYAAEHSLGLSPAKLKFRRRRDGKWVCRDLQFSLTHTEGYVAAAVSNGSVGVDLENISAFLTGYGRNDSTLSAMWRRILTPGEAEKGFTGAADFLSLWTKKEACWKSGGEGSFHPECLDIASYAVVTLRPQMDAPLLLSVCGDHVTKLRLFLLMDGTARLLRATSTEIGSDLR